MPRKAKQDAADYGKELLKLMEERRHRQRIEGMGFIVRQESGKLREASLACRRITCKQGIVNLLLCLRSRNGRRSLKLEVTIS